MGKKGKKIKFGTTSVPLSHTLLGVILWSHTVTGCYPLRQWCYWKKLLSVLISQ